MREHDESRIERLTPDRVDEGARTTLDAIAKERGGVVPNLFRVAAHRPEIVGLATVVPATTALNHFANSADTASDQRSA